MAKLSDKYSFRKCDRDSTVAIVIFFLFAILMVKHFAGDGADKEKNHYGRSVRNGSSSRHYAQPGANDGSAPAERPYELFAFDPNTADSTQLLRLGLQPWQVRSIYKYRSHGGRYRSKEDFARLYGLTLEKYRQLEPYIRIKKEVMAADVVSARSDKRYDDRRYSEKRYDDMPRGGYGNRTDKVDADVATHKVTYTKLRAGQTVDINTADTTTLKMIPGIGSYFARRIVELRMRRQMFVSPEELLSIRNFPETALTYMTVSQNFSKIYINKESQKELAQHPLLNYTQARDIVTLRRTTGTLHNIKELSVLPSFTQQHLQRVSPYIVFE